MSDSTTAVVRVAATPDQAKVFVAILQSAGVPAYVEGDSLADEFAISRRMMNLGGIKVMVPASSLERARSILAPTEVDEADLAAQALAATGEHETPSQPLDRPRAGGGTARVVAGIAIAAALLFFFLWQTATQPFEHPLFRYTNDRDGVHVFLRRNGAEIQRDEDPDRNGIVDRVLWQRPDGSVSTVSDQVDEDGQFRRLVIKRRGDLTETWTSSGAAGSFDKSEITDADGRVVQRLSWQPGHGWRVETP